LLQGAVAQEANAPARHQVARPRQAVVAQVEIDDRRLEGRYFTGHGDGLAGGDGDLGARRRLPAQPVLA
jgi:hypothetical protein